DQVGDNAHDFCELCVHAINLPTIKECVLRRICLITYTISQRDNMKSKFGLNLPYGVYASIFIILCFSILIWFKADYSVDKIVVISLFVLFSSATIQAASLIRMDKFDIYKNILNAIWNIETAITFIYGIYVILEFSYLPTDKQPSFTKWAFQHIE